MKKLFFIAAMAGAALVSCTKNEGVDVNPQQITFSTPVVGVHSKAPVYGEITPNYHEDEHFGVFAVHYNGDLPSWAEGSWYMGVPTEKGLECFKQGNTWAPAIPYYWPKEGTLSFAAYSPYELSGAVTYGGEGLKVTDYTVDEDITKHVDFLYAPRVYNTKESTLEKDTNDEATDDNSVHKYKGVNIMFKHAMSSIVFKVAKAADIDNRTKITLKKISLNRPITKADFVETVTDGPAYVATPKWVEKEPFPRANYETFNGSVELTTTLTEYVKSSADIIVIPQKLHNSVEVVLNYQITNPGGYTVDQETRIKLNGYTLQWLMGMRYTYNITIGLKEVIFDPAVTDWVDESFVGIVL